MKQLLLKICSVSILLSILSGPSFAQGDESKKATVVLDSPAFMKVVNNQYRWDATLRETGGKSGFEVKTTDFYILAPDGGRWINDWNETHKVRAGGAKDIFYTIDVSDNWAGGMFHCVWEGKDDAGNPIRILQEVKIPK